MSNVIQFRPQQTITEMVSGCPTDDRTRLVDDMSLAFYGISEVVGENDMTEAVIDAVVETINGIQVSKDPMLSKKIMMLAKKFQ